MTSARFSIGVWILVVINSVATETDVRAFIGEPTALPCRVDTKRCGQLHSVKWYKDANRVYVLSHAGQGRAEGDAVERMTVELSNGTQGAVLKINPVEGDDEATYKCEITYLEVIENCDVVQIVKLKTLKIPENVKIHKSTDHTPLPNSTLIGPMEEDDEIDLICEATGGKPTPKVRWFNGTTEVTRAKYTVTKSVDGVETGISTLQLTLKRGDLLARFECRVESEALDEPIISWVQIDVHVRPTDINLTGVENHVVQGTNVKLDCKVFGARPAATVRWANGSSSIDEENFDKLTLESPINTRYIEEKDGTFTTISSLSFKASHWENGKTIYCFTDNEVMKKNVEPEFQRSIILDVRYPPVITVKPTYAVVNESTDSNVTSAFLQCLYYANPQELLVASWLKDGKPFLTNDTKKYVGGTNINPPLYINNVVREDMGDYKCSLGNVIGTEVSPESVSLNVLYTPDVEVLMEPFYPIISTDKRTVIVMCNVTSGNPSSLLKVRWFLEGELMKEFPECNYTSIDENGQGEGNGGPFCGLDPSILSLERVDESFAGNYTCQGMNVGGWGPVSEPQELVVYYPPGPAKIRYSPSKVVKGGFVTLTCTIESTGRPDNVSYIWYRGSHVLSNVTKSVYNITSVGLETRNNFSCRAVNDGGKGEPASVFVNVYAAPAFTKKPPTYQGILYTSKHVNLTCIVECYPECSIQWYKDGVNLDPVHNPLYKLETHFLPSNPQKNDFESVNSTLIWNLTAWPGQMLNKTSSNSNYTCQATSNKIGLGVSSTAEIAVDYPPEEVRASSPMVNVKEGEVPASVKCTGKGRPTLTFQWKKNYTSEPISNNDLLVLPKLTRSDNAAYICEASNKHGSMTATVYFNVQYPPECTITTVDKNGTPALVCTAIGNPQEMTFNWTVKEGNETFNETNNIVNDKLKSYLLLDSSVETYRTYYCVAHNLIGHSSACKREVAGNLSWWKQLNQEKMIIIIASIVAVIVFVIIICIIIIILCRRKRADTKYNSPLEMEERENPEGQSPDGSDQAKWPLQPGVLIHINKMNNISISQLSARSSPYKTTSVVTLRKFTKYSKYKRNKSKIYYRLERLASFLGVKKGRERIPSGIKESAGGVVTFRRVQRNSPPLNPPARGRKRKKPGSAPNMSSTEDKPRLGVGLPLGGTADPSSEPDGGFYENLPFHGIQNPPNKPISIIAPFHQRNQARKLLPSTLSQKSLISSTQTLDYQSPLQSNQNLSNIVKRNQSFSGFQCTRNTGNFNFTNVPSDLPTIFQYLPTYFAQSTGSYTFSGLPNNINSTPKVASNDRINGRRDIRTTASGINVHKSEESIKKCGRKLSTIAEKRFGSLDIRKHKCYSPTFYSMRCKKHAKKRPIIVTLPKKCFSELALTSTKADTSVSDTSSIQITEENSPMPVPAPRSLRKKHEIVYANLNKNSKETEVTKVEVHKPKLVALSPKISPLKNSPVLKVSPNFVKPKTESPKGALSIQLQAKLKPATSVSNENIDKVDGKTDDIPKMPILHWNHNVTNTNQNAFYTLSTPNFKQLNPPIVPPQYSATIPHPKHAKLAPKSLFHEQIQKSKSFSSKSKQKKHHFQIPLQKCHSFKFQTAESYFQPIKNIHEENLLRNGYMSDYPEGSAHRVRHQKKDKHKHQMSNKGPLVVRRPSDYQENVQFQENVQNSVQLQYPQPLPAGREPLREGGGGGVVKANGIVYADLDMPSGKRGSQDSCAAKAKSSQNSKKTEYATLNFNEIGQEIDV